MTNLPLYKFIILNGLLIALVGVLYRNGVVHEMLDRDTLHLCKGIAALFTVAWLATLVLVWRSRRVQHFLRTPKQALWLNKMSGWLATLGLLGTVVGFGLALSGINPDLLATLTGAKQAIGAMMQGMYVALDTTLVGAALGLWCEANMQIINSLAGRDA